MDENRRINNARYIRVGYDDRGVGRNGDISQRESGSFYPVEGDGSDEIGVGKVGDLYPFIAS